MSTSTTLQQCWKNAIVPGALTTPHILQCFYNPPFQSPTQKRSLSSTLIEEFNSTSALQSTDTLQRFPQKETVFFFFGKLHVHFVNLKPNTSSSTLLLQEKQMPFELELICNNLVSYLNFLLIHGTGQIFTPNFLHPITHTKELCNNLCESRVHSIHSLRENAVNFITLPQRTKDTKVPSCKILTQDSA